MAGGLSFSDFNSRSAAQMQGGAGAAGNASVAENFGALEDSKLRVDKMMQANIAGESAKRRAAMAADASVRANAIANLGAVTSNNIKYDAMEQAAEAKAGAAKGASLVKAGVGLIGSIAMSDETTKDNIQKIDDALTTLRNLRPVTFQYNKEYSAYPEKLHYGFIAQEYRKVMPDHTYTDTYSGKMCIDTSELVSLLVRAIQQLEGRVTRLEVENVLEAV